MNWTIKRPRYIGYYWVMAKFSRPYVCEVIRYGATLVAVVPPEYGAPCDRVVLEYAPEDLLWSDTSISLPE